MKKKEKIYSNRNNSINRLWNNNSNCNSYSSSSSNYNSKMLGKGEFPLEKLKKCRRLNKLVIKRSC